MKKIILIVFTAMAPAGFLFSQLTTGVGINTEKPDTLTILHIDAKGNNKANNPDYSDDVIISAAEGFVGVGKTTVSLEDPQSVRLDIKGGTLRLDDGKVQKGDLLASKDALGTTKWIARPTAKVVTGQINDSIPLTNGGDMTLAGDVTKTHLELTEGKWMVFAKLAIVVGSNFQKNAWIILRNRITGKIASVVGVTVEQTGGHVGTPQLTAIVDVEKGKTDEYIICGYGENMNAHTTSSYQGSVFYAVRLNEDTL
jgi:hypothetical protein